MKFDITVVIPVFNGRVYLEKNLPRLLSAKQHKLNRIREVIIVDDASKDDSVSYLENNYSDRIRLLKHSRNRGFASSVNFGVRKAKTKFICLLNQDVLPSVNFLENVLPHFRNRDVFGVTLHEPGFGPAMGWFSEGYLQHKSGPESRTTQNSLWVNGGSGVFRKKIWKKLNGFDEVIFSPFYWEDVDLGYRALKRGYKLLWEPKALVEHKHESTINSNNFSRKYLERIKERNHLLFVWKNITSHSLFSQHKIALIYRLIHHPGYLVVLLMSLVKYESLRKKRKREVRESTVSDEAILAMFSK